MPRVVCRFEAFVRAIQATDSLGNEVLSLHSMNNILANVSFCNQTTIPKTQIQSKNLKEQTKAKCQNPAFPIGMEPHSNLVYDDFATLILVEETNSKILRPATFENLTTPEFSKRYNAQLSSQKRTNAASANYPKHKTQRKLKMPRVFGLLELFVVAIQANRLNLAMKHLACIQ
ncbi:hypothetical protein Q8W40_27765 [Vibrio penaeicida]|uniref:hypothetical protein n=1 Tax=Vibrio penaeicida TaxID=104609 RepID=UPI002734BAA1|nr:hypothetical protein [Vibrio penaeicida]MDP2576004.1 hypothetical protein [Vibrio penaeicida]